MNTIRKARRITFAEINEKWLQTDMSEGIELARSTFARHKDAIEDIFGIYIDCDRQNGYEYYIGNDYVLREDSVQNWMLSTLSVNNVISESLSLQNRILLQQVPYEGEYLKMVMDAMKKSVRIAVEYRKYGTDKPNHLNFEPYCIKLFKQRWYKKFADCELYMRPTIDLSAHFLSRGSQVKVLTPKWLAEEVYNMHMEAAQMYEEE